MQGIGLEYLIECPVFNLEDDQALVFTEEDKIRLTSVDVRQLPGQIFAVGFGGIFQKSIEMTLAFSAEVLNIIRDH